MNRRDFLKTAAGFLAAVSAPAALIRRLVAAEPQDDLQWLDPEDRTYFALSRRNVPICEVRKTLWATRLFHETIAIHDFSFSVTARPTGDPARFELSRARECPLLLFNMHPGSYFRWVSVPGCEIVVPKMERLFINGSFLGDATADICLFGRKLPA